MNADVRRAAVVCAVMLLFATAGRAVADELWVAPTYQQDVGGLGIGSNVAWPATVVGAARLAWAIPNNLQTFQSAKVVMIPHPPGGAANLNVLVCAAENAVSATANCAGPFAQSFTGVANQLTEIEIGGIISSRIGNAGTNYVTVLVYSTPTAATDHILGMRFAYTSKAPSGAATLGANTFSDTQTVQVGSNAPAVLGVNTSNNGATYGVEGRADGGNGIGVYGLSTAASGGASYGVYGDASQNNLSGTGVFGIATSYGLYGVSTRTASSGVYGRSQGTVGLSYGVYGDANANTSGSGIGVFGTGVGFGLYGQNMSNLAGTAGVWGDSNTGGGAIYGVGGQTNSTTNTAAGVIGKANGNTGITFGVQGANASNTTDAAGVRGDANAATGSTAGGYFRSASSAGTGVLGWAPASSGATYGVRGESDSPSGTGVFGFAPVGNNSDRTFGVKGQSNGPSGIGVGGFAPNGGVNSYPSLTLAVGVLGSAPNGGYGVYSIGNANVSNGSLSVDGDTRVGGVLTAGTIQLPWVFSLPTCDVNSGNSMSMTVNSSSDDSHMYVCRRKSDFSWEWHQVF